MGNKPQNSEFCWNELMTSDVPRAKEFYKALFGWENEDHDMGDMVYTLFKSGDKSIGGLLQIPQGKENQIPPHWMSYVSVAKLEQAVEKGQKLGATLVVPPKTAGEFGRLAVILDPTGAHIALWEAA
ncbi:MAG TPA: VOC family protein [Gammaproteobacteria bacterium]|nr:VOC family protein [Gammaproteobacteria bacterium]